MLERRGRWERVTPNTMYHILRQSHSMFNYRALLRSYCCLLVLCLKLWSEVSLIVVLYHS